MQHLEDSLEYKVQRGWGFHDSLETLLKHLEDSLEYKVSRGLGFNDSLEALLKHKHLEDSLQHASQYPFNVLGNCANVVWAKGGLRVLVPRHFFPAAKHGSLLLEVTCFLLPLQDLPSNFIPRWLRAAVAVLVRAEPIPSSSMMMMGRPTFVRPALQALREMKHPSLESF